MAFESTEEVVGSFHDRPTPQVGLLLLSLVFLGGAFGGLFLLHWLSV